MKQARRICAAVLTAVLCLTILMPLPARAEGVCYTAINERVLQLSDDTMPIWSGDVLYAPYTSFDENVNGVPWGIECSYNKNSAVLTVYDIDKRSFLEFDLREGTCVDGLTGEAYKDGAILRGGRPYLPVKVVCTHFNLRYSYREIEQGSILRLKNDDVVLSDPKFLEAAVNVLDLRLKEYNQSKNPSEVTPSVPSSPQEPTTQPTEQEQEQEPDTPSVDTYLALRCEDDEFLYSILTVLGDRREKCMFFLTPELAERRADLVIWMLGAGHSVGLLAQSDSLEETRALLEQGSRALADRAFFRADAVLVRPEHREALEKEGWVCWNSTLELAPRETDGANYFSRKVIGQLSGRTRTTWLSIGADANTLRVLSTMLGELEKGGFVIRLPLEPRL